MTQARGVMGQLLRSTYVETAYNYNPASMACFKLPFNTCDLKSDQTLTVPATIRGRRDPAEPIGGNVNVAGSVVVPLDRHNIGHWLKMALGAVTTTSTAGNLYQHVFKVNSTMASYVMEQGWTDIGLYQKFSGCKVGGWGMTIGGEDELTLNFDIVGAQETPAATSAMSGTTEYGVARYGKFDATLKEGGTTLATATEVSFTVNNNLDENIYCIDGTPYRNDLPEGLCTIEGTMRVKFETWSLYIYAMSLTERSVEIDFAVGSDQLQIVMDEVKYKRMSPGIPSAEGIWQEIPFQAFYTDAAQASVIRAILINSIGSY